MQTTREIQLLDKKDAKEIDDDVKNQFKLEKDILIKVASTLESRTN